MPPQVAIGPARMRVGREGHQLGGVPSIHVQGVENEAMENVARSSRTGCIHNEVG